MKRIAYAHRTRALGVEGVHIHGIADSLNRLGYQVTFFGPPFESRHDVSPGNPPRKTASGRLAAAMPEFFFELLEILYSLYLSVSLVIARARLPFDAIYERYAIFGFAGAVASEFWGIPLLLEVNYTSRSPLVRQRNKYLRPLAEAFDRWIFARATVLIAVSSRLRDQLVEEFGVPRERVLVLPNAADPAVFRPAPRSVPAERFTVGFVGGFFPWHGVDLLVTAIDQVAREEPQVTLVLVGDGPERPKIERMVADLGLQKIVKFTGNVAHKDLASVVATFDVGVMPDSNDYGSPMKIFEYMAMAKPVIAPDYPPIHDAYCDGVHGYIFPKRDATALADTIRRAARSPNQVREMGVAARQLIEQERNWMANTVKSLRASGLMR